MTFSDLCYGYVAVVSRDRGLTPGLYSKESFCLILKSPLTSSSHVLLGPCSTVWFTFLSIVSDDRSRTSVFQVGLLRGGGFLPCRTRS